MLSKFKLQLGRRSRVNLVIKDHVIRFLDSKYPDLSSVKEFDEKFLPDGIVREGRIVDMPQLVSILKEAIDDWGISRRDVQFIVPDSFVVVRKLQVPIDIQHDEVKGFFYMEIGSSIHLPFDNPVFDTVILGENNGKQDVLLFATPENIVMDYALLFEQVKLNPVVADISPLALYRLYHELELARQDDHVLCVQFDIQTVNISIFHNHKIIFMRHLRMDVDWAGWKREREAGGDEKLEWSGDVEYVRAECLAMISEVERVMNFYRFSLTQGKEQVTRLLLTGDHPYLEWIEEQFKARIDVSFDSLRDHLIYNSKGERITSNHHLTLGLSLKEVK